MGAMVAAPLSPAVNLAGRRGSALLLLFGGQVLAWAWAPAHA